METISSAFDSDAERITTKNQPFTEMREDERHGWSQWIDTQFNRVQQVACCGCGLVHDHIYRRTSTGFKWCARTNHKATEQVRQADQDAEDSTYSI